MPLVDFFFWDDQAKDGSRTYILMLIMLKCDFNLESYIESYNIENKKMPAYIKKSLYIQLITGIKSCLSCGLFHRDIKT